MVDFFEYMARGDFISFRKLRRSGFSRSPNFELTAASGIVAGRLASGMRQRCRSERRLLELGISAETWRSFWRFDGR